MHLKLTIEYDGTDFSGSQLQPVAQGRSVQGELESALERLAGSPVRVALAGRTDAGVHARGQVASLHFPERPKLQSPDDIRRAANAVLPPDVAVRSVEEVPEGFHARFSAARRAYRYLIWNAPYPSPLISRYSLHVRQALSTEAMSQAAAIIEGTHDLAAFAGQGLGAPDTGGDKPGTVRTVYVSRVVRVAADANWWTWNAPVSGQIWREESPLIAVDLVANAFLPQMVRTIVGTLLEVGTGKRSAEQIAEIIRGRDRSAAGPTARPHGLCLLWVEY